MKEREPCQYCGTLTERKLMHERYCKKNPKNSQSSSAVPPIHTPAQALFLETGAHDTSFQTDSMDEYKNIFGKLPKFELKPPGVFKKMFLKKGTVYKHFVFVDKDGCGEEAFLPYDVAKERVVVDKLGYWPIKVKGDIIFLSKEKLLPLADAPDLSRFQNSANYVWSVYNGGLQEGVTKRYDEIIDEIRKDRMFRWMCLAIAVLALVALAATAYTDGKTISALIEVNNIQSQQLVNLTKVR